MTGSPIYRSARLYNGVMRLLYGRRYTARHRAVADRIRPGASVLELCCGPGRLYTHHLRGRVDNYLGLDLNPRFVQLVRDAGATAQVWDLRDPRPLPPADSVVMQAALYHFLPDPGPLLDRMLAAASETVVIAEPVRNLSDSPIPAVARIGAVLSNPGTGDQASRFTEASLAALLERYRGRIVDSRPAPGGREHIYVLQGAARS